MVASYKSESMLSSYEWNKMYSEYKKRKTKSMKETITADLDKSLASIVAGNGMKFINKVKEYMAENKTAEEIAKLMNRSEDWVKGSILILTKLPESVHDAIAKKKFSRTTALQLLLVKPEKLEAIVRESLKIAASEENGMI